MKTNSLIIFGLCLLLFWSTTAKANNYRDTLKVSGANLEHLSLYTTFWVDSSKMATPDKVAKALSANQFNHWEPFTNLNLGLNPYPLWLHIKVKNTAEETVRYWWSMYSHADSIKLYRQTELENWQLHDAISFLTPIDNKTVKTRFPGSEFKLKANETISLLIKVENYHKTQNAFIDFTTPDHNLLWEKKFFWSIAFFAGCFILVIVINLIVSFITKELIFFWYASFVWLVLMVALQEELLIVYYPSQVLFPYLIKLHPMGLIIIASGLHFIIINSLFIPSDARKGFYKMLYILNKTGSVYGIILVIIFFFFSDYLTASNPLYRTMWQVGVVVIFMMMTTLLLSVLMSQRKKLYVFFSVIIAYLLFYYNPAGYYLNYAGVASYYTITYPNYFYWALSGEFVVLGCILALRYRSAINDNLKLIEAQANTNKKWLEQELEIQERERKQIARDLHDDLGATISAIKLIVSNSYTSDQHLLKMINKASDDLRVFTSKFSTENAINKGIFFALKEKLKILNSLNTVKFELITGGDDSTLTNSLSLALLRISTELINNIMKHAKATQATIQLLIDEDHIMVMVEDNGIGFEISKNHEGIGLDNIEYRVNKFKGKVHITSNKKTGTTTIINIPINPEI